MLDFYTFKHFNKMHTITHTISTKNKNTPLQFSLALHTGQKKSKILDNRLTLSQSFQNHTSLHYIVANQTHSDNIQCITQSKTQGWQSEETCIKECDALITNLSNVALTILTADCVPILLFDPIHNVIAAVHAGWKGTKMNIVAKTVQKMKEDYGSNASDILAGIAPSIGKCCYEVENNVAHHFKHIPKAYTKNKHKYMLDLPLINKQQLLEYGLQDNHIEMSNICTACEVDRFFSYRAEKGCSGRFMSLIVLNT